MKHHKSDHQQPVNHIDLTQVDTVGSLIDQMAQSGVFGAGSLAKAIHILSEAYKNESTVFVGLAGAMVPGGMRKVISQAIRDGRIHCLTTTGANITHDLIEAFGGSHLRNVPFQSDVELRDRGIDRVYDSFVAAGSFTSFEEQISVIIKDIWNQKSEEEYLEYSPSELIRELGIYINDEDSIVKAAYDKKIPIFIPALTDSVLGLQLWLFSQFNRFIINPIKDLGFIQNLYHESSSRCALLLGGGVPKNYTLQAALMAAQHYDYAVQVTMDRVETGGLSGASLEEAISWGKIEPTAKMVSVIADVTIVLPIIYATLRELDKTSSDG
ncbi:MAG: deoxyhypusine synthase family protein [Candidatus Kariarchaeaceae archaeon]|jgi:deoxyhypusine synthase